MRIPLIQALHRIRTRGHRANPRLRSDEVAQASLSQPKDGGAHKYERLSSPPFAEAGQGLAVVGFAFFIAFLGKLGDGKLGFDEARRVREIVRRAHAEWVLRGLDFSA